MSIGLKPEAIAICCVGCVKLQRAHPQHVVRRPVVIAELLTVVADLQAILVHQLPQVFPQSRKVYRTLFRHVLAIWHLCLHIHK